MKKEMLKCNNILNTEDIIVDYYRSSPNVNTEDNAVRINHIPTGITIISDSFPSKRLNLEKAKELLNKQLMKR